MCVGGGGHLHKVKTRPPIHVREKEREGERELIKWID